jgi:hypothetical protein
MSGIFSKSSRPTRPGAYFNWVALQPAIVPAAIGSVVAVAFTHTWGPEETAVQLGSVGDFLNVFGDVPSSLTPGYKAVKQAFQGEDVDGVNGAGTVIAYRMTGSAVAAASHAFTNTTPATALTVTAKYKGTYGNNLNITTQVNAADGTKTDLLVYAGTVLLETWTFLGTDIAAAATAINAGSNWITAVSNITGTRLTYVTNVSLTGGNDGSTLIAGDYTQAMTDLGKERFGILVFQNLTDSTIIASLKTWAQALNLAGKRFFTVLGGATDENAATAVASALTLNDENFIRFGVGHVLDSGLLDANGLATALSPAEAAPRIAGILAARGERLSMTFAHVSGWTLVSGPSDVDISTCQAGGVLCASTTTNTVPVRLESSRTTFTTTNNAAKPYAIFRNPKAVAIMQGIQSESQEYGESEVVGNPVDAETRAQVLGFLTTIMDRRVDQRIVQSGYTVKIDPVPPASDDDEFVAFEIDFKYGRSAEQVYFTGQIG